VVRNQLPAAQPPANGSTEEQRNALFEEGKVEVAAIRQHFARFVEVAGSKKGNEHLDKFYQSVRFLSTRAGLAGCVKIAQLTGAIEAMLFDQALRANGLLPASSIQTLSQGVECLEHLFGDPNIGLADATRKARVLVVDDDEVCNRANETALKRVNYEPASATNAIAALMLLNKNPFDLILLDINMPTMNGLELCQKLRSIPLHKDTPVIFVTAHGDSQNRTQGFLSGGDDLIAKPISPLELIVKATVFLFSDQARLKNRASPAKFPPSVPAAAPMPANSAAPNRPSDKANLKPLSFAPGQSFTGKQSKPADGKDNSFQAVIEKLQYLKEALAEETKKREGVERQAARTPNAERNWRPPSKRLNSPSNALSSYSNNRNSNLRPRNKVGVTSISMAAGVPS
jgi:DNA-binding response OmpR family regulator